jgi:hypothetical protein
MAILRVLEFWDWLVWFQSRLDVLVARPVTNSALLPCATTSCGQCPVSTRREDLHCMPR